MYLLLNGFHVYAGHGQRVAAGRGEEPPVATLPTLGPGKTADTGLVFSISAGLSSSSVSSYLDSGISLKYGPECRNLSNLERLDKKSYFYSSLKRLALVLRSQPGPKSGLDPYLVVTKGLYMYTTVILLEVST
jgi:hypothetical protein